MGRGRLLPPLDGGVHLRYQGGLAVLPQGSEPRVLVSAESEGRGWGAEPRRVDVRARAKVESVNEAAPERLGPASRCVRLRLSAGCAENFPASPAATPRNAPTAKPPRSRAPDPRGALGGAAGARRGAERQMPIRQDGSLAVRGGVALPSHHYPARSEPERRLPRSRTAEFVNLHRQIVKFPSANHSLCR